MITDTLPNRSDKVIIQYGTEIRCNWRVLRKRDETFEYIKHGFECYPQGLTNPYAVL